MPKTHRNIVNKSLRRWYALELWQARQARPLGKEEFAALVFGLESGIWAVQKGLAADKCEITPCK